MDLNEKIKQILVDKNITPSIFADEIGIQRSSMSHIIAGRNKPSLDIVQKIIKRFPELGVQWILDDEILPGNISEAEMTRPDSRKKSQSPQPVVQENVIEKKSEPKPEKHIEKVLVFYSDGTFKEFKQA